MCPPPDFGVSFDSQYLIGLAPVADHMVILINIEKLISSKDLELTEHTDSGGLSHEFTQIITALTGSTDARKIRLRITRPLLFKTW